MANVSRPTGFRPVRFLSGAPYNGKVNLYFIPASDSTAMAVGDLVDLAGSADSNGVPTIARATAVNGPFLGAIVGFLPSGTNPVDGVLGTGTADLSLSGFRPASTARYALVADDPDLIFMAQASGAFAVADTGLNASVAIGTATSNGGAGMSNMQVDMSTKATTATLGLHILGAVRSVENDLNDTSNLKLEVMINQHRLGKGVAGV
jgi:hypothetical protein